MRSGWFDPRFEENTLRLGIYACCIPSLEELNTKLREATGWQLDPTMEYGGALFGFANRRFPALQNIRSIEELDRAKEPDMVHDYIGHPWMLVDQFLASIYEEFGRHATRVAGTPYVDFLARLYTNVIEFGLQFSGSRLQGFGAALASSPEELANALFGDAESEGILRVRFDPTRESDVLRIMRTDIYFSQLQKTYFVLTDWEALMALLKSDLTPYYETLVGSTPLTPGQINVSDELVELDFE